ncbi:hypothetical protein [Paenibacillus aceti]|uniref:Secreted protein n=1 Tax=Paenibacillus aceti TaxID=1820010 RepID=A0ABQ1WBG5_9BACL|nr:hypothetical protein [Paenibacillus aceti]GGG20797.1 hypothetical protein GCM10010913_48790 [Paenibacillus aceti]
MKLGKMSLVLICIVVVISVLTACGADDIKHKESDNWRVSFQRSTGACTIVYLGEENLIENFRYEVIGNNISQEGKALKEHTPPFKISGTVTDSEKSNDPIEFKIFWNNQSENVVFE